MGIPGYARMPVGYSHAGCAEPVTRTPRPRCWQHWHALCFGAWASCWCISCNAVHSSKGLSPRLHEERIRSSIARQQEIRKQTHCRMQLLNYCTLQERKSVPKSTQVQETNDMACALSRQDTPDTSVNNCQSMIETKAKGKLRARAYR